MLLLTVSVFGSTSTALATSSWSKVALSLALALLLSRWLAKKKLRAPPGPFVKTVTNLAMGYPIWLLSRSLFARVSAARRANAWPALR